MSSAGTGCNTLSGEKARKNNGLSCKKICIGDPIDAGSGNEYQEVTNFQGGGAFPPIYTHDYNRIRHSTIFQIDRAAMLRGYPMSLGKIFKSAVFTIPAFAYLLFSLRMAYVFL
ncbi:hypothetical protein ACFONN_02165 [Dyella humi]|uniref:Uncharacterized protein n=1 Tax=Dyella humi TaxID=1770547 RepID=A0ABW8ICY4_9GAMM